MLGRYYRLAARQRDGREQAGITRHSFPLECLYVSSDFDLAGRIEVLNTMLAGFPERYTTVPENK